MNYRKNKKFFFARSAQRTHKGGKFSLASHAHDYHQIILPHEGVVHVSIEGEGSYFLSRGQGIFIGATRAHEGVFSGVLVLDNLYFDAAVFDATITASSFVFRTSELCMAVCASLASKDAWLERTPEFDAICLLLAKEMNATREEEAFLPMPKDPILKNLTMQLKENPSAFPSIDATAIALGISSRHLRRIFRAACGITLSQWLGRARLMLAKEMLASKTSISAIALELGFQEFASFSRFFKQATGMSARTWTEKFLRE